MQVEKEKDRGMQLPGRTFVEMGWGACAGGLDGWGLGTCGWGCETWGWEHHPGCFCLDTWGIGDVLSSWMMCRTIFGFGVVRGVVDVESREAFGVRDHVMEVIGLFQRQLRWDLPSECMKLVWLAT